MNENQNSITVDVEEWFHILDSAATPDISQWPKLENRIEANLETLLEIFEARQVRATFFWIGWIALRCKHLLRRCHRAGHEIASHGFEHLLAHRVGPQAFLEDITRAKKTLEDITGRSISGFRAPGFGITPESTWVFDIVREAGYRYDASVFPAAHSHGGMPQIDLQPHCIDTVAGPLIEAPVSAVSKYGRRWCIFGGGYLRLAPKWLIRRGIAALHAAQRPLIVYVHPREIDPNHPRLKMRPIRRFKTYVNLETTRPKLEWLCREYQFQRLDRLLKPYTPQEK